MQANMGFPTWTLWGMGLAAVGALIAIGLALVAQTPRLLSRSGLTRFRFDLRGRSFTVYGFALLLLGIGFFLAGVPLGSLAGERPTPETVAIGDEEVAPEAVAPETEETETLESGEPTPSPEFTSSLNTNNGEDADSITGSSAPTGSGAFAGLPTTAISEAAEAATTPAELAGTVAAEESSATQALTTTLPLSTTETVSESVVDPQATQTEEAATPTSEPSSPTPTSTATPTATPTESPSPTPTEPPPATALPLATPTPIDEPTAVIGVGTSTLWVMRTPGGQNLLLLRRGDTVILLGGHANYDGLRWQQVSTLDGVIGWVQEAYLDLNAGG